MGRLLLLFAAALSLAWSPAAFAKVVVTFHSFNGSVLVGRYPHAFVAFDGTLADGTKVRENYGFSAKSVTPAILSGPVDSVVFSEKDKWLKKTNRHFSVTVSDAKFREMKDEIFRWANAPPKFYDLEKRNCIHFVGRMAEMVGLKVEYPSDMLRRPRNWLNHVSGLNPRLGAKPVD